MLGTLLGATQIVPEWLAPAAWILVAFAAFLATRRRPRYSALALSATFAATALLLWNARHGTQPGDPLARYVLRQPGHTRYEIVGRVERPDVWIPGQDYLTFILRCDSVTHGAVSGEMRGGVVVRWSRAAGPLYTGERVRVAGPLRLSLSRINPDTPSAEDYYRRHGVHTALRLYGPGAVHRVATPPWYAPAYELSRFRGYVARNLAEVIPASSFPLVRAVWLGDRDGIDVDASTAFLESGTAHILAVSGVHTGIVFVSLAFLVRLVIDHRRVRITLVLIAVFAFALFTGARVSSVRAAVMIALYLTAAWFDREPDAPTALSLAAMVFLLHNPDVLFDTGFRLSFLSIGSILLFADPLYSRLGALPTFAREGAASTLSVQLLPLPIAIQSFHVIPIAAPFANLLVIPLLGVLLWLIFLTSVLALIAHPIAHLFGFALHPVAQAILLISDSVARAPAHVYLSSPTALGLALYAAAVVCLYRALTAHRARFGWSAATATAFLAAVALWRPFAQPPEVDVLDVGHGDAIFLRTPGGATLLVDAGDRSDFTDLGRRVVAPFLWSNHESRLDALLITHPDRDHIGGARYILEHIPVGVVLLGPQPFKGTLEDDLLDTCRDRRVPVKRLAKGDRLALGGATLDVLHPPRDGSLAFSRNNRSLTVRVAWDGFSILLPGDLETEGEQALLHDVAPATILKVPHHGSDTSSSAPFLDALQPTIAVVSVGPRGTTTVLDDGVLDRYRARAIPLFRTDRLGGVRIRPTAQGIRIESARLQRGYLCRTSPAPNGVPATPAKSPGMW